MTTTDLVFSTESRRAQLIAKFLPNVRSHITRKYGWMERRGNCLVTVDDLIQIASMVLVGQADKWDKIATSMNMDPASNDGAFWAILRTDVRRAVFDYLAKVAHFDEDQESLEAPLYNNADEETEESYRTSLSAPTVSPHFGVVHEQVMDFFLTLPRRDKVYLALRYFDELSSATVGELLETDATHVRNMLKTIRADWRTHARNQIVDYPTTPTPRRVKGWEPPELLTTYLRDRHRKDLPEYLAYVTMAFRADISYPVDVLGRDRLYMPDSRADKRTLSPYQELQVDKWIGAGMSMRQIARDLGVEYHIITTHAKRRGVPTQPTHA